MVNNRGIPATSFRALADRRLTLRPLFSSLTAIADSEIKNLGPISPVSSFGLGSPGGSLSPFRIIR
jgi:hypothetical protein